MYLFYLNKVTDYITTSTICRYDPKRDERCKMLGSSVKSGKVVAVAKNCGYPVPVHSRPTLSFLKS